MSNFLAYISRMKYIKRWGLMRSSREENVQEHSLQVAMFAHCLALIENKRYGGKLDPLHVMAIAVYHETGEVITGDLVTPIKYYNPQITQAYKEVEKVAEETMIAMLPEEFQADYRELIQPKDEYEAKIVKAADTLAAYAKCIEELKTGNIEFAKAKETVLARLHEMEMPCVEDFLREFMPGFEVTLDELNEKSC